MKRLFLFFLVVLALLPAAAQAWWNAEWTGRRKVMLDTTEQGGALKEALAAVPVLVRLHTGNFAFADAHMDGNDLRFVADDDKTPLEFHIEKFDGVNELALVWVKVPKLAPGSADGHVWLYYGNDKAPAAGNAKGTYSTTETMVLHFAEADGAFRDVTAYAQPVTATGVRGGGAGVADGAAVFDGSGRIDVAASPSLKSGPGGMTVSAWVKPADPAQKAVLFGMPAGGLQVRYEDGKVWLVAREGETAKVDLAAGAWHHVAAMFGDRIVLYVDGREAAAVAAKAAEVSGQVIIGEGFRGELDELQTANVPRSAGWIATAAASQGDAGKLVKVAVEAEAGEAESTSYFRILLSAVTLDGWVVIGILMVMMVISFYVMASKGVVLARTDSANKAFQKRFAEVTDLLAAPESGKGVKHASLHRIYEIAARELSKRLGGRANGGAAITAKSIDAIRATLDAQVVRENARLNSQMVLLTISISGGPFLGLLGTVVGVMITFAAIAAAGDVNVNSIAPGIAAALVATVAGLGVAIPALFGYNYLASRIKGISADMQVFVDELTSRIAESYAD